jgi:flagellin
MPQVINTNMSSLNAQRNLMSSQGSLQTALQRLSSGLRINSAKDDAAGLAIASRMAAQIGGLNQAIRNANDGISLAQTAEGALGETSHMLTRIRDLSVQAANDTNSGTDRAALQQEVGQLQQEINRIANETEFNGKKLLDGTFIAQQFQVGANANQTVAISMSSAKATDIGSNALASDGTSSDAADLGQLADATTLNTNAAQQLTISGSVGVQNVTVNVNDTAKAIADAVNAQTASTGVSATARTTATIDNVSGAGTFTFNLYGSNALTKPVAISATIVSTSDLSALADAINAKAASTGITATAANGKVNLVNDQGHDIAIENVLESANTSTFDVTGGSGSAVTLGAAVGTDSARVAGLVNFSSSDAYTVSTDTAGTLMANANSASTLSDVGSINVGSQAGANSAISVVDGALGFINGLRAKLGAVQNRIESTVSNLAATSENLSAAKSRIEDADFAKETAELTRAQVLQQAGMAMLAQSNALPNQVLTLLRQ